MNTRAWLASLLLPGLIIAAPAATAAGNDELWEISSKTEFDGMPIPAPPQRVCKKKGQVGGEPSPMGMNCKTTDHKTTGNRVTYRIACAGKDQMNGTGERTTGPGRFSGKMDLAGTISGEKSRISMSYSGKLVGSCTAR